MDRTPSTPHADVLLRRNDSAGWKGNPNEYFSLAHCTNLMLGRVVKVLTIVHWLVENTVAWWEQGDRARARQEECPILAAPVLQLIQSLGVFGGELAYEWLRCQLFPLFRFWTLDHGSSPPGSESKAGAGVGTGQIFLPDRPGWQSGQPQSHIVHWIPPAEKMKQGSGSFKLKGVWRCPPLNQVLGRWWRDCTHLCMSMTMGQIVPVDLEIYIWLWYVGDSNPYPNDEDRGWQ